MSPIMSSLLPSLLVSGSSPLLLLSPTEGGGAATLGSSAGSRLDTAFGCSASSSAGAAARGGLLSPRAVAGRPLSDVLAVNMNGLNPADAPSAAEPSAASPWVLRADFAGEDLAAAPAQRIPPSSTHLAAWPKHRWRVEPGQSRAAHWLVAQSCSALSWGWAAPPPPPQSRWSGSAQRRVEPPAAGPAPRCAPARSHVW